MQFVVQLALVVAVIGASIVLMRGGSNARHLAIRRILLVLFAAVAAFSVIFPETLTRVARLLGIGRGTDLVLYALIVSFLVYMATTFQRFRQLESAITELARRIAIDEAPTPDAVAERLREEEPVNSGGYDSGFGHEEER